MTEYLFPPGMPKAAIATPTFLKFGDDTEFGLDNRNKNHLRDPVTRLDSEWVLAAVPNGNKYLTLVIRIDQPDQIAEHDTVLVAETRARQQHGGETGIVDVYGDARRDKMGFAGSDVQVLIQTGVHVETRGSVCGITGQRKFCTNALVEYF